MPTVSVVIPALNEAENLQYVLPLVPPDIHEVILVDGGSADGTVEAARRLRPSIRIFLEPRRGKGAALLCGFRVATGDIIVALDANGTTDPREIPRFVEALATADYAKGSRFLPGGGTADKSLLCSLGNRMFVVMVRLLYGTRFTDVCYGVNAFWRRQLPLVEPDRLGFEIATEMYLRAVQAHLAVTEVPTFELSRFRRASNLDALRDGLRVLDTIIAERFRAQSRAAAGPVLGNQHQDVDAELSRQLQASSCVLPSGEDADVRSHFAPGEEGPEKLSDTDRPGFAAAMPHLDIDSSSRPPDLRTR